VSAAVTVRVVRTFGHDELHKDMVLAAVPPFGAKLNLAAEDAGLLTIEEIVFVPRGDGLGFHDPGVTIRLEPEPASRLTAATLAGWRGAVAPASATGA